MSGWPAAVREHVEAALARHSVPGIVIAAARGEGPATTLAVLRLADCSAVVKVMPDGHGHDGVGQPPRLPQRVTSAPGRGP
ncbi:MAG: hypothetical protein IT340_12325 [Chloroflexi bacterium]|nr:hypothetical protein [Chloroflexota bacterium]